MNELPAALSEIFFRLQGSPILDYNLGQKALRLLIQTKVAQLLNTGGDTLNLVLEGCSQLYYLSFTQTLETRTRQYQSEDIFKKGLVIQA